MRKKIVWLICLVVCTAVAIAGLAFVSFHRQPSAKTQPEVAKNTQSAKTQQPSTTPTQTPVETKPQYSTDDPNSIWVVVNKKRSIASTFVPTDLVTIGNGQQMRSEAAKAAKNLVAAASQNSLSMKYISGYRSYSYQRTVYNGYVKQSGQTAADTFSARPGHSEHQTGLAVDLGNTNGNCDLDTCFGDTTAGKWLAGNAYKYGFIIRYPKDKTSLTGYQYEPWHIRYVGTDLALELRNSGQTLEQYFGLSAATNY